MKLMVEILPFDDAASHFPEVGTSECIGAISITVSIEKCRVILEYRSLVGRKSTIVKGVGQISSYQLFGICSVPSPFGVGLLFLSKATPRKLASVD